KKTFDVSFKSNNSYLNQEFSNDEKEFNSLLKLISYGDWVVMEASGIYHLRLATFLVDKRMNVCVENTLVIKRYSQSRLYRAKTDKKDAQIIAEYGVRYREDLKIWKPETKEVMTIRQLFTRIELLDKQVNQTKMQKEAFSNSGYFDSSLKKELNRVLRHLQASIEKLEKELKELANSIYGDIIDRLVTIPGI